MRLGSILLTKRMEEEEKDLKEEGEEEEEEKEQQLLCLQDVNCSSFRSSSLETRFSQSL